jgi:acyl-[acyl carrier protein]--UDP-N-acetylglucosamine O-acyltransferase
MKYKLLETQLNLENPNLKRIQALIDIPRHLVTAGDIGGWVQSETNLSQEDDCWIGNQACVTDNACVKNSAYVGGWANVGGSAQIVGLAKVFDNATVNGFAYIGGEAMVGGYAQVNYNAYIGNLARVTKCLFIQQFLHSITITDTHVFFTNNFNRYSYRWSEWFGDANQLQSKTKIKYELKCNDEELARITSLLKTQHCLFSDK